MRRLLHEGCGGTGLLPWPSLFTEVRAEHTVRVSVMLLRWGCDSSRPFRRFRAQAPARCAIDCSPVPVPG